MPSDQELAQMYPAEYYAYQEEPKTNELKQFCKRILGYWQGVTDPCFDRPGVFLDIGCGSGSHVERMRQIGWKSYGVELNHAAATRGAARGLQIFSGNLFQAGFSASFFDYVRASHSLEHMPSPHEILDEIHRILKPDGKLLVAVPNIESFTARLFRQYWWHLGPPIHPFSYSCTTLTRLLKEHGFHVEKLRFNSDYVGLLGSFQIWLNRRKNRPSSSGLLFQNRPLRVLCGWLQTVCDLLSRGDMIEVTASVAGERRSATAMSHEPDTVASIH